MGQVSNTIAYLKLRQEARAQGYPVAFTTDPAWLVNMAINRRAGWQDDPTCSRGSCMPVLGMHKAFDQTMGHYIYYGWGYPHKAEGQEYDDICRIAERVNTPRMIVRLAELGQYRRRIMARIPNRITLPEDE